MVGINYLKTVLDIKRSRVLLRYKYYEMKNKVNDFAISTPPNLRMYQTTLGWCAKSVDSLADRLNFREFRNDFFDLNQIFDQNNSDVFFDSAILSALISSCCFVYIYQGEDGYPCLQVIDGSNATGVIDPVSNLLTEGYAVLKRDVALNPITEAYFTPTETVVFNRGALSSVIPNPTNQCLLVPVIFRPDAKRPFGHSRITRACMDIIQSAMRTVKRSEIAAEFYSYPQKYVTNLSQDAEKIDKWNATMSAMMSFTKDDEGDHPILGQFASQSMTPHTEQLRMFAALFAGETGLTLDDLGFATENPSSEEAIKAQHENLRLTARKAQRTFGAGFKNVGFVAACLRDQYPYLRRQLFETEAAWDPVFEPDASALSGIGDGINKLNQAIDGYVGEQTMRDLTGIRPEDDYGE